MPNTSIETYPNQRTSSIDTCSATCYLASVFDCVNRDLYIRKRNRIALSDRFFLRAYTTCSIILQSCCDSIKRKLVGLVCHVAELKRNLRPSALRIPVKDTAGAKGCISSIALISVVPVSQLPYTQQLHSRKVEFADATL